MGRIRRWGAALMGSFVACSAIVGMLAAPVSAAAQDDPWVVDEARFEPLGGSPLGVAGVGDYRGSIRITRTGGGLAVINALPIDDYLRGISEVPPEWPFEAQKAQAIAARTYALHEAAVEVNTAYKAAGADICATDACQVYAGLAKERRPGSERWSAAVDQTKGQVLVYNGAPIVAKYSSSNGGQIVSGGQPYLRAGPDPDDIYSPLHQWRVSYAASDVARVVGLAAEPTALRRDGDEVVATSVDADGNPVEQRVAAAAFRSRLNAGIARPAGFPLTVPSIRFDVTSVDGLAVIDGRGWGHGIGLSQYGALGKAARGLKAPDILAAYYGGLRPVEVPADRLPSELRVAIALDRAQAAVRSPTGRFRVTDGAGTVLAHIATGAWSTVPAPNGRIRIVPPADQAGAPGAVLASSSPGAPHPGEAIATNVELQGPAALTRITLTPPDGATRELDPPKLRASGVVTIRLGPSATAAVGLYRIDLERDAGGGRAATTSLTLDVAAPAPAAAVAAADHMRPSGRSSSAALQGLATILLLAVVAAGALWVGRTPSVELH